MASSHDWLFCPLPQACLPVIRMHNSAAESFLTCIGIRKVVRCFYGMKKTPLPLALENRRVNGGFSLWTLARASPLLAVVVC